MIRIAIRVDASDFMGTGHVMRCLTLADALRPYHAEIVFICRAFPGHMAGVIQARGYPVHLLPILKTSVSASTKTIDYADWIGVPWKQDADETLNCFQGDLPDWLLVDHYGIDCEWEKVFRAYAIKLIIIDDLANRNHVCDILLDQNVVADANSRYRQLVPEDCVTLIGPDYALLTDEYKVLRRNVSPRAGEIKRILVSYGGGDANGLTERTVVALLECPKSVQVDVVLSSTSPFYRNIEKLIECNQNIILHDRQPSLAPFMQQADLAIGASGTTNWERFCLGLPTLVITTAENQLAIAGELEKRGLIKLVGHIDDIDGDDIENAIRDALQSGLDPNWSSRCLSVVDGKGADRVCNVMMSETKNELQVRPVKLDDEHLLLQWANDKLTRQNAFSPEKIAAEDHHRWFLNRLDTPQTCLLYIVETNENVPVGQTRFDLRDDKWEISYGLSPDFRGIGLGRVMLAAAIRLFLSGRAGTTIFGQVKPDNVASAKIFHQLGFGTSAETANKIVFERTYGD